jgi:uncharacterized membrane protein
MVMAVTVRILAGQYLLAQAGRPPGGQGRATDIISWSLVLIGGLIAAFVAVAWFRKWMHDDGAASDDAPALTLGDLRELRARGEMTEQEYELAKAKVLVEARAMAGNVGDPLGGRDRSGAGQPSPRPAATPPASPAVPTDNTDA